MPLSRRVPDLASLDLLLSVARTGSLGGAAREHGVTQQAASLRIRRLETLLGVAVGVRFGVVAVVTKIVMHILDQRGATSLLAAAVAVG